MKAVFADTLYWVAVIKPNDPWKETARKAKQAVGQCVLVTTDEVLTEFLNALSSSGPLFRTKAVETVRRMLSNPNVRVVPQTRETFLHAVDRYERRKDKTYNLVDCASMNVMDVEGIKEVLTHDHHFTQEGYIELIKKEASA
jgi:predicted nucleic acid-binding protein